MRVVNYEAHNVGKVSDVKFDLAGRHLFIVGGKNSAGKTSALKALQMALCGKSGMEYPEVALKEGENEGWVKVALEDPELSVELHLKRQRNGNVTDKLQVTGPNGPASEPRTLLQRLYSMRAFDPLAFENMDKKERRKLLLELVGIDFAAQEATYKKLDTERAAVNREGKTLAARFDAMPKHDGVPEEEVSVQQLVCERDRRQAHNRKNQTERDRLDALRNQKDSCRARVKAAEEELAAAQKRLDEARAQLEQSEILLDTQQKTVGVLEDQDVAEVTRQLSTAEETNRKVRENRARAEVGKQLDASREEWKHLDAEMKAIKASEVTALENAKWPVKGLGFDSEGVLFNGLPFEQASKSQRVLISTQIGMALNPRLKLLVCEDGSDLDADTLKALEEILEKHDFQLLLELVTRSDSDDSLCAVVIEDGKVK